MKLDMDQASRQSLPNEVTTERVEWRVVGFADRTALPEKILKFCGTFPIYEIEEKEFPMEILDVSRREISGRLRSKRDNYVDEELRLCTGYNHKDMERCLKRVGLLKLKFKCRTGYVFCYYIAECSHKGPNPADFSKFTCRKVSHTEVYMGHCCTVSCD